MASRAVAPAVHASGHATLQAVAARDIARAGALEPTGRSVDDYQALLNDDAVEAVYISLTNDVHLHWITAALAAGKHVLCEKPITLTADECRVAFAAARSAGLLLVEAAWPQWHPRTRHVDAVVAAGDLGKIETITSAFTFDGVPVGNFRLEPARGGGSLLDVGPYLLRPAACWVNEDWTVAVATVQANAEGADLRTTATLTTTGGTKADISSSFVDPEHQELVISGTTASVTYGAPAFTSWREASTVTITDRSGSHTESFPPCDAYELMVSAVSQRIRNDTEGHVIEESQSVRCMELIDLVYRAARTP